VDNLLNDLSGSEWLYWTNTIYPTNYPLDVTHQLRKTHGAIKPPELMADIIRFFTKKGELVLDPFAGVGSTLLGAALTERKAVGFELNNKWVQVYREIQRKFSIGKHGIQAGVEGRRIQGIMVHGDCLHELSELPQERVEAIITDPPYGCRHRVEFNRETNFSMFNPGEEKDFGNLPDYKGYLQKMGEFGREAYRVLKRHRYLVLLIGDRYQNSEYMPLSYKVAEVIRAQGFKWKGLKIWWNQSTQRPLKPYAIKRCYVPNITHQNILIFRKE